MVAAPPSRTHDRAAGTSVARLHGDEADAPGLNLREIAQLRTTRLLGSTGTVLMAIGALGAGAQPVLQNPTAGTRLLSLPSRIITVSLTMTFTGALLFGVAWLLLGRFAVGSLRAKGRPPRRLSRSQIDRTLLLWMLPLIVAPPMYSKDVYSYLAQSKIAALGLDPYRVGPGPALGLDNIFSRTVPNIWRDTPAPYGPLFLWIGRGINAVTGDNVVLGIYGHRLFAMGGVALMVWALPRLARRCGVAPVTALWLGVGNPLLLFHLVAGVHNEALMLGLMLAGAELALRAIDGREPLWPQHRTLVAARPGLLFLAGVLLIVMSALVKAPSLLALGFLGMVLARRWGGSIWAVAKAGALLVVIFLIGTVIVGWGSGLGFGWIHTLSTANVVRSWMSLPTLVGLGTGQVGIFLGLGDHTTAVLALTRGIASLVALAIVIRMLYAVWRGKLHPMGALGVSLGAFVLLAPVVQPWYLLWAITPLAAWANRPAFRVPAVAITLAVSIIGPMSNGAEFEPWVIVEAAVATVIIVGLILGGLYYRLPWTRSAEGDVADDTSETPARRSPESAAYADTP